MSERPVFVVGTIDHAGAIEAKPVYSGDARMHAALGLHRGRPWRWIVFDNSWCPVRNGDELTQEERDIVYDWLTRHGYTYESEAEAPARAGSEEGDGDE